MFDNIVSKIFTRKTTPQLSPQNSIGERQNSNDSFHTQLRNQNVVRSDENIKYETFNKYIATVNPVNTAFYQILNDITACKFILRQGEDVANEKSPTKAIINDFINVKSNEPEFATNFTRLVEYITRGLYFGEMYVKIVYMPNDPMESFIDFIPNNICQNSIQSEDNYIQKITVSKERQSMNASTETYIRNTPIREKPTYFVRELLIDGVPERLDGTAIGGNSGIKEFLFYFTQISPVIGGTLQNDTFKQYLSTLQGKINFSRLQSITPLIEAYIEAESKYIGKIRKEIAVDHILMPIQGARFDKNEAGMMTRTLNSKTQAATMVSETPMTVLSFENNDAAKSWREECSSIGIRIQEFFGIPKSRLEAGSSQYANQLEDNKRYLTGLITPLSNEIAIVLNTLFQSVIDGYDEQGYSIVPDIETHLMYVEIQAKSLMPLVQAGIITEDEARIKLGYEAFTDEQKLSIALKQAGNTTTSMFG
jgi:hypothetical protein